MPATPQLLGLSPLKALWVVTWPTVAIGVLKTTYFLTDSAFIGQLGDPALSAAGGAAFAWWILVLLGEVAGTGAHSLVARATGAGRSAEVSGIGGQAIWVGLAIGLAAQIGHPFLALYFDVVGFDAESVEHGLGQEYLAASLFGAAAFALHAVVGGVFRGIGDTRTAMWITALAVALNAVLDPLLIWGAGPVPALGIAGAAWATVAANGVGAVLGWVLLARGGHAPRLEAPQPALLRSIAAIGAPVSARGIAFAGIYVFLGRMITTFGTHQMAALGVGHRIESIPFLTCVGFETGCATLVGQYLGAGDVAGARRAARTAVVCCGVAMVPCSLLLYGVAEPLFALFASEPQTIEAGALYLRVQTTVFVFMALESVYEGGFTGSGRTVPSFWIGSVGTAARLPLAWLFASPLGLGVVGIWWAIAVSTLGKGVVMALWFERYGLPSSSGDAS